jgi:tetratricopeptide (TPR) repeat protein
MRRNELRRLNLALINQGRYEQAVKNLRVAVKQYPDGFLWLYLGEAYYHLGQYQAALKAFDQATTYTDQPSYPLAYSELAWTNLNVGDYEKAIHHFDRMLSQKSGEGAGREYAGKGRAYQKMGRYDEALGIFNEGLKYNPQDSILLRFKAETLAAQRQRRQNEVAMDHPEDTGISNVPEAGEPSAILPDKIDTLKVQLDTVAIDPELVKPGARFDVVVDFIVNDPRAGDAELTVTMNYAVSQGGKVLKRFQPKVFQAPNNAYWSITRQPQAAKTPGTYTLQVELIYQDQKAAGKADFTIQ